MSLLTHFFNFFSRSLQRLLGRLILCFLMIMGFFWGEAQQISQVPVALDINERDFTSELSLIEDSSLQESTKRSREIRGKKKQGEKAEKNFQKKAHQHFLQSQRIFEKELREAFLTLLYSHQEKFERSLRSVFRSSLQEQISLEGRSVFELGLEKFKTAWEEIDVFEISFKVQSEEVSIESETDDEKEKNIFFEVYKKIYQGKMISEEQTLLLGRTGKKIVEEIEAYWNQEKMYLRALMFFLMARIYSNFELFEHFYENDRFAILENSRSLVDEILKSSISKNLRARASLLKAEILLDTPRNLQKISYYRVLDLLRVALAGLPEEPRVRLAFSKTYFGLEMVVGAQIFPRYVDQAKTSLSRILQRVRFQREYIASQRLKQEGFSQEAENSFASLMEETKEWEFMALLFFSEISFFQGEQKKAQSFFKEAALIYPGSFLLEYYARIFFLSKNYRGLWFLDQDFFKHPLF